ncbi:hypothetical protein M918_24395, partial [Clostridium sp. BL8]|uniref:CAP domain-containing protein n=1 Tax=Clostridium sp. BL8 TaxID=1354301 RepID=UPI00038A2E57
MITNKLLALTLSLFTAGSAATGAASTATNKTQVPKFPTQQIVQKQTTNPQNSGQTINSSSNSSNTSTVTKPQTETPKTEVPVKEQPKVEAPVTQQPKVEAPKIETPVKEEPKTEAPKVETPATTPSATVPSGVPANPNNKSFVYLDSVEKEILTYVNQERAKAGLNPLTWEENMRPIARYKSNNMLQYNYFEHNTPSLNNASPMDLATKYFKYSSNGYGENIFYSQGYPEGTTTAKYLVDQWMNSPGHRANILNANWTKMSAGVVFSSQGNYAML